MSYVVKIYYIYTWGKLDRMLLLVLDVACLPEVHPHTERYSSGKHVVLPVQDIALYPCFFFGNGCGILHHIIHYNL